MKTCVITTTPRESCICRPVSGQPKERKNVQGTIIVLIAATAVLLLAGIGSSTGMMTYKNEQYGFSIAFPEDWAAIANYEGAIVAFVGPEKEGRVISVNIAVDALPKEMSVEEYAKLSETIQKDATLSYYENSSYGTTINGEPCQILTFTATYTHTREIKQKLVYFIHDRTAYIVSCSAPPSLYDEANEMYFESMIQSSHFKGVEPTLKSTTGAAQFTTPGFGAVFAIVGILAEAYLLRRRR